MIKVFERRKEAIIKEYNALIEMENHPVLPGNGVYIRFVNPVLTAKHVPLEWRYDFYEKSNPFFMERISVNATFNAGAIKWKNKYVLMVRVEGVDRKSFFALAESENGIDNFRFRKEPVSLPQLSDPDVNVYDIRLTAHEDGWIYGVFCTERRDESAPIGNQSAAIAQCGIIRSKDLEVWERLPDLITNSPQQRNVVLHPEFVNGMYGFYTRPQDNFIEAGKGGGIAFGLTKDIMNAVIIDEKIIHAKKYHTVYEAKNGQGPTPLKTQEGWLHLAHGVRNTAAGLRYVLYLFMTSLEDLTKVIYQPAGYFLAPAGDEFVGDVGNVVFTNGWIKDEEGSVFIYYASSDTRMHVALTSVDQLLDYVKNTPSDGYYSALSVERIKDLIAKNIDYYE
ncbi:glycoside hydrolase family 130 protein [Albibacterium bauzanense]|uniref:4-O-beta-D-mannosyl-D-glucose phosphorylase n=1 Tax=Albibacterium bauzanense TaxID=653929 RepID=A0A4R1LXR2_9SPHI|nr:glycosidase [Albibacterium bauzanense]TCK83350.1 4-O-beta-D-mannosyl-D-glucose phosphorylase [Albibacterium bauzanense]